MQRHWGREIKVLQCVRTESELSKEGHQGQTEDTPHWRKQPKNWVSLWIQVSKQVLYNYHAQTEYLRKHGALDGKEDIKILR